MAASSLQRVGRKLKASEVVRILTLMDDDSNLSSLTDSEEEGEEHLLSVCQCGNFINSQWLCLRLRVAISRGEIYTDGVRYYTQSHRGLRPFYVENFVELCIRNSRNIEGMKKRPRKKSLNLQLVHGFAYG